ncbi:acyl-CoA dehydrogenase/oxidase C-terminal, partial [Glonium stellatum]
MAKSPPATATAQVFQSEPATHSTPPSSSTDGFFQTPPKLENSFYEDAAYRRIFSFYLPESVQIAVTPDLSRFGSLVLQPSTLAWTADAERNPPYLRAFDTWGRRSNTLITSEGWRKLQDLGIAEGIVAIGYENQFGAYSRLYQFLKYHLWAATSAGVTCPSAMQDGAARLLAVQLARKDIQLGETERRVFETAYQHLTSRNPECAWTSGQWMTERAGGSDVRNTETQATFAPLFTEGSSILDTDGLPLGPWSISGFKWFSSATDSQMTILLAKTPSGALSAFLAPMRRQLPTPPKTELNGLTIQRLKPKLGTRPVPTAELVLTNTRAYLLGNPGQGVKTITTILNLTRIHNAVSAMGTWARGLAVARAFARVRRVGGGALLVDTPAHIHSLARLHLEYRGMLQLAFFGVALLGLAESPADPADSPALSSVRSPAESPALLLLLLRLLTPLAKALTARAAIAGLAECMEALGGVGYLENEDPEWNVARLFRDANVLSIWEGTTDVMAADVVR